MLTMFTIIIILILSGLCSCSETALYSISQAKAQKLAEDNKKSSKTLLKIKNNMEKYIGTIVFANNAINIFGASILTGIVIKEFGQNWVNVFTAILTLLIIIFSEIIPKNLGERKSATIAPFVSIPVVIMTSIFRPLLYVIDKIIKFFMRIIEGAFFDKDDKDIVDEAEILATADLSVQEGGIDEQDREQIQGILHLDDKVVGEIMTPKCQISKVRDTDNISDIVDYLCDSQHSRVLVENKEDEFVGYIHSKNILSMHIRGQNLPIINVMLPIINVFQDEIVDDVLDKLTKLNTVNGVTFQQYIAVVKNKPNAIVGVITLEDIQEEVFGQIYDETDHHIDLRIVAKKKLEESFKKNIKKATT
jgi:CBS domain containing-hemolysin-like protein